MQDESQLLNNVLLSELPNDSHFSCISEQCPNGIGATMLTCALVA